MKKLLCSLLLASSTAFGVVNYAGYKVVNLKTVTDSYWQTNKIKSIQYSTHNLMHLLGVSTKYSHQRVSKFVSCYSAVIAQNMDHFECKDLLSSVARSYRACNKETKGKLVIEVARGAGLCTKILHP